MYTSSLVRVAAVVVNEFCARTRGVPNNDVRWWYYIWQYDEDTNNNGTIQTSFDLYYNAHTKQIIILFILCIIVIMWDNVRVAGANFRRFASEKSLALPDDIASVKLIATQHIYNNTI